MGSERKAYPLRVDLALWAAQLFNRNPWAMGSIIITATAIFLVIAAKTTRGGWRWRWGEDQ